VGVNVAVRMWIGIVVPHSPSNYLQIPTLLVQVIANTIRAVVQHRETSRS
jgi:hypothetical protein